VRTATRKVSRHGLIYSPSADVCRLTMEYECRTRAVRTGTFQDIGRSQIGPITVSNSLTVRPYRDRTLGRPIEGNYTAWVGGTSDYISVPYRASTDKSPGNAITTGDFYIGCYVYFTTAPGAGATVYMASVQDATATAAGTAWALGSGTGGSQHLFFVYCDGTTRSLLISAATYFNAAGRYLVEAERVNGTLYTYVNGALAASVAFSSAFNVPNGGVIRFGTSLSGAANVADTYFDGFQIKPNRSVWGGAAHAVPGFNRPIPY
jgi:hypothetical protein